MLSQLITDPKSIRESGTVLDNGETLKRMAIVAVGDNLGLRSTVGRSTENFCNSKHGAVIVP